MRKNDFEDKLDQFIFKFEKELVEYWLKNYCTEHCTICGNTGIIDSRGVKTAAGYEVGRLNYCICPNGLALREQKADMEGWLKLR